VRLKWTANKALAPEEPFGLRLKRPRSNPESADARQLSPNNDGCGSYGDPVLEWRRPGGSVSAVMRQGSQAYLSLPPSCYGVATLKQGNTACIKAQDSARKNGIAWESVRTEESATSPELAKEPPVTGAFDGCECLGQVVGAQGVLTQPE